VAACLSALRLLSPDTGDLPGFLAIMAAAFACYFAVLLLLRRPAMQLPAYAIVLIAALIQLAPFRGAPLYDTDAYRYHWDGKLLAHGINPFRYAPGDHALAPLRDEYWPPMQYKHVQTIYPPVAQYLLAATWFLDPTPRRVLLLAAAWNLLCLAPLLALMRRRGVDDRWLAIYAWNPLLAAEFALGGHLDPIAIFFLLCALLAVTAERRVAAGLLIALAVLAKTQMIFVAPLMLRRSGWRGLLAAVVLAGLLSAPFLGVPLSDLTAGSRAYLASWESNSSVFALLQAVIGGAAARAMGGLAVLVLVVWLSCRRGDLLVQVPVVLGALLVLGPTFFPWYVSWVLPFACLFPNVTLPVATCLLLASYLTTLDRSLGLAARVPEFALMYGVGLAELISRYRPHRPAPTSPPSSAGSP